MSTVSPMDAVGFADTRDCLVQQRAVAIPDRNTPTGGKDAVSHRQADALRGPGHDRDPVL